MQRKGIGIISKIENNNTVLVNENNLLIRLTLYGITVPKYDHHNPSDQEPKGFLAQQFLRSYLGKKAEFEYIPGM